jgi:hypothetical protein
MLGEDVSESFRPRSARGAVTESSGWRLRPRWDTASGMRLVLIALLVTGWGCREAGREKCRPALPDGGCPTELDKAILFCVCGAEVPDAGE